jgi:hypothetical protein
VEEDAMSTVITTIIRREKYFSYAEIEDLLIKKAALAGKDAAVDWSDDTPYGGATVFTHEETTEEAAEE